ncbi:MAG: hypothetical protein NBV65_02080 [Burkholderiaceae bacterium]|nr:hypothetical protein [Burkholderiaceae bacterium]
MRNFVLGLFLGLSASTLAIEHMKDGSVVLDREDVQRIEIQWYQMNQNLQICAGIVHDLRERLEAVEKAKCT